MKIISTLIALVSLVATAAAAANVSAQRGEELFNSTKLGTNGKSCATCHPKGQKLTKAARYDEAKLVSIINGCVENALAGNPLPKDSPEMTSLVMYLRTLAPK